MTDQAAVIGLASKFARRAAPAVWQRLKYYQYLRSAYGEFEIRLLDELVDPDRHAIDVGVFLGMYSRRLLSLAQSVIGFEANPESAAFLRRCFGPRYRLENVALSSKDGVTELRIPMELGPGVDEALGSISRKNPLSGGEYKAIDVRERALDSFSLPPIGFMKIDVEGHEEEVLAGARELLLRDRPTLMIEVEERHNPGGLHRVEASLRAIGYSGFFHDRERFQPLDKYSLDFQTPNAERYINNFFFSVAGRAPGKPS